MQRTIQITVAPAAATPLLEELRSIGGVVGLSHQPGASLIPPGDVITVHAINRATDAVMKAAQEARIHGPLSVVTAEIASVSDAEHQAAIDDDVDEAMWEELETGLRHQGRITTNFLLLMALGGVIAAAGAVAESSVSSLAYVASAIIAPGFEPVAKIPLGIVLRRREVLVSGLTSTLAGYAVLMIAAALTYLTLAAFHVVDATTFLEGDALHHVREPGAMLLTIGAAGAVAGVVIESAYRRSVIAGALVALSIIEAASAAGIAGVLGRWEIMGEALSRLAIDGLFILAAGVLVFGGKQLFVHRRAPLH